MHALSEDCADPRYPALAGAWAVGCGARGEVDRAVSLETGTLIRLPIHYRSPGLAPGVVYGPGGEGGMLKLVVPVARGMDAATVHLDVVAPAATDGTHVAVLGADQVQAFPAVERSRKVYEAHPAGWYPPALAWPWVAWVEDGGPSGEDVFALDVREGERTVLAEGPGPQRHVVGSGSFLAWVESDDSVTVLDTRDDHRTRYDVRTGFSAPPSLWNGVVCWEERGRDVDIRCSDRVYLGGEGHQQWPSRHDRWLLYREDGQTMLYTVEGA
ncbi:MAG: hypothetical protein QGG40_15740 [Myxococcota bacterium]|nr:hypothetical protein [Myxococcota bacterium]